MNEKYIYLCVLFKAVENKYFLLIFLLKVLTGLFFLKAEIILRNLIFRNLGYKLNKIFFIYKK